MDVDRFIAENQLTWDRLAQLVGRRGRRARRLHADDLDELVVLYQRVSSHLSYTRTYHREPALTARLTDLVARSGALIYGTRAPTLRAAGRFVADTIPAALWYARHFLLVSALAFLFPAAAVGLWLANSPAALEASAPAAVREAYVNEDFEDYYSSGPSAQFATAVTVNNIQVSFLAFAAGIAGCLYTVYMLAANGAGLGWAAGLFAAAGQQPKFWGLILPHGLLELSAVFIAGAAGLRLGWTLIDPGDRPRGQALIDEGRRAVVLVVGLVGVFLGAGLIEGFVTGSPLPTWARVGIGVTGELVFVAYAVVRGRAAAARGLTGALGEDVDAGWRRRPRFATGSPVAS
jgi:uncharacterized membrane protein SpoIIM required for sporulation